jgi:pimeloyl-ACP methyl ester carboxylesterase
VYETNWNSPDPTSFVYASSHQPTGGSISGNPGSIYDNLIQAATTVVLGTPVFNNLVAQVDPNAPSPALPNTFVNALSHFLDTNYDDGDFVVLVGHSLGGNSILRVANQTQRKIDLLVPLDPVGWSHTGVTSTDSVQIIPPINLNVPQWLQDLGYPDHVNVFGGLTIPIPVGALGNIFSTNMLDPVRGLPGYRNELESPGSNVRYFLNRWQTNIPFPLDYNSASGQLDASLVRNSVDVFSYHGQPVAVQEETHDYRDANGNPVSHPADFYDILWGYSSPDLQFNIDFGTSDHIIFPPDVTMSAGFTPSSRMDYQDLPLDTFVQAQINAVLDGMAPSTPITVSATSSNHDIRVGPGPGDGNVLVSIDGVGQVYRRPGPVIITASGGDHTISVDPTLPRDVTIQVSAGVNTLAVSSRTALTVSGGTVNFSGASQSAFRR